jgi:PAS domain S-box-containing protein
MPDRLAIAPAGPILILAPTGRDADGAALLLSREAIDHRVCRDAAALCAATDEATGALLIADEALESATVEVLSACLDGQPPWSDLPVIVLTRSGVAARRRLASQQLPEVLSNVMFLERPLSALTLVSAVRSALRARRRQRQLGEYLAEREASTAALQESETRFRTIADVMPQIVWSARPDGHHDYFNQRWYEYTGLSRELSLGGERRGVVHQEDRAGVREVWHACLATGRDYVVEYRFRRHDGAWRWFMGRAVAVRDTEGRIAGWYGTCTDIQDQVEAREALARSRVELERLVTQRTAELTGALERLQVEAREREQAEDALRQAQKMEAVGRLTGGIAHDFNNLLQAVVGSLELIRMRVTDERVARLAASAFMAAERGAKLTAQLLAFSRSQRLTVVPVDVNAALAGMQDLLARSIAPPVEIRLLPDAEAGTALTDANQFELAVLNLAINARDAMPKGGSITLSTSRVVEKAGGDVPAGDYVSIAVADTGTGMAEEVRARALEPFFTTKPTGQGTGLGLAQVYGIARQSGGTVRIDSAPGRGTTVRILLPLAAGQPAGLLPDAEPKATEPDAKRQATTILVVDDDPDVRNMLCEYLDALGYRALVAGDGPAGLRLLAEAQPVPALLLVDFAMPGMTGAEVAQAARRDRPDLPIVFATGYAETAALQPMAETATVLRKPFRLEELSGALQAALERPPATTIPGRR